jgi:tetratricopeptide (TPR) repeat protein
VTNVTLGTVPYSDSISKTLTTKHCSDDSIMLPSKEQAAQQFIYKLKPNYIDIQITLLDIEDIDYSDRESALLDNGLKYIEQKRFDKAEQLLSRLVESTQHKSYVAAYNLGVVKEAKGDLIEANKYYHLSDQLQIVTY